MSDSQRNSTAPDFQPLGTSASLRMLGSVMGRIQPGSSSRGAGAARSETGEIPGGAAEKSAAAARGAAEPQSVLDAGWTPSVARAGMQVQQRQEAAGPLWSSLPKADLKPVVSAVEADLGTFLAAQRETSGRGRAGSPELALLAGQSDAASIRASSRGTTTGSGSDVQQAAVDISTRLLDAVRSHAAAQAVASDSRISLGDLTLIAFADSKRQMAAATSHAEHTPDPHPLHKAIDNSAHKKFMEDRKGFDNKLKKVAELAIESLEKSKRIAKERFGSHG
ncbi:MAG: hypothetical protein U0787_16105 [Polyangia bacterium]|jgi:hypothetical protein